MSVLYFISDKRDKAILAITLIGFPMRGSQLVFLLALAYLGTVSAKIKKTTVEKDIVHKIKGMPDKTYKCIFKFQHDEEDPVIDPEISTVKCSPTLPYFAIPFNNVELKDDKGHVFMVNFQMNPDRFIQGEYAALTPQELFQAQGIVEIEDGIDLPCGAYDPRLENETDSDMDRGAHHSQLPSWPNGIIPYRFDANFNRQDRLTFAKATQAIEANTCVRFKPRRSERIWLRVIRQCPCGSRSGKGCFGGGFATLGSGGRPSKLTIGSPCIKPDSAGSVKLVAHELLHSLGIGHTQTRPDRGNYIWVYKRNIQPSSFYNYKMCTKCQLHGTPYDCASIMHYRDWAFSVQFPQRPTMVAKNPRTCDVKKTVYYLTKADIALINAIYKCRGGTKPVHGGWSSWSSWSTCRSGTKYKYRLCNNPKPAKGGRRCSGKDKQTRKCSTTTGGNNCPEKDINTRGRRNQRIEDGIESWSDCAALCAESRGCTYWTWHHEYAEKPYALRCVLMDRYGSKSRDENAMSGKVSCAKTTSNGPCPEKGINTRNRGHSQRSITNSWQECARLCNQIPFCTYWTWHPLFVRYYARRCVVMAGYGSKAPDRNAISGSKKCYR